MSRCLLVIFLDYSLIHRFLCDRSNEKIFHESTLSHKIMGDRDDVRRVSNTLNVSGAEQD